MDPQINLDGAIYHQPCAKCADCFCQINLHNFAQNALTSDDNVLLCKIHYKSRLKKDGNNENINPRHSAKSPRQSGDSSDAPKCSACALLIDTDYSNNSSPESESITSVITDPRRLSVDRYALYEKDQKSPNFSPVVRLAVRVESAKSKFRRALAKMSPGKKSLEKSPSRNGSSPIRDLGIDMVNTDADVVNDTHIQEMPTEDNNQPNNILRRLSNFMARPNSPIRDSPSNPVVNNGDVTFSAPRRLLPRTMVGGPTPSKGVKEGESTWDDDITSFGDDIQGVEEDISSKPSKTYPLTPYPVHKSNDNDMTNSELDDSRDTETSNCSVQSNSLLPSLTISVNATIDEIIVNEQDHEEVTINEQVVESEDIDDTLSVGDINERGNNSTPPTAWEMSPYQIYIESQANSNSPGNSPIKGKESQANTSDAIGTTHHSPNLSASQSPDSNTTVKIVFPCDDDFPMTPPSTPMSSPFSSSSQKKRKGRSRSLFVSALHIIFHGYVLLICICTVHSLSVWYDTVYPQDTSSLFGLTSPWIGKQNATRLINRRLQTLEEEYTALLGRNDWSTVRMSLSSNVTIESCKSEDVKAPMYIRTTAVFDTSPEELHGYFYSDKYDATQKAVDAYYDSSSLLLSPSEKISVMRKVTKKPYFYDMILPNEITVALVQQNYNQT
eukprot:CAMPEP_0119035762 /NCGR_PEP_ID=MMETSP1177-20130426/2960_1 /TAXON_ID=2985 /ORGANISM="Ochromonas sp, Strain CCMP1899" /LENGTH=668 /DNA_ID=CAMNT_0006994481 /DNA_START=128 /DNA_END=2135 /DNA_ORIENTATION=-